MADFYLIRFADGPAAGDYTVPIEKMAWPLPDFMFALDSKILGRWVPFSADMVNPDYMEKWIETVSLRPDVVYEKESESQLPGDAHKNVARGAQYRLLDEIPIPDEGG
jgi:hypothetical protein